jgi:HEAT repeat protein
MASTGAAIQVIDFVRALAMAWKNLAAYPRTHPAVVSSLQAAEARLTELRGPAGEVTLGIASNSLVYGSMTIDSAAAQKLAFALYARGVAMLRFGTATTGEELETFLRLLAASTPGHDRRPIWEEITAAGVVNINLQPVAYGAVQLSEDLSQAPKPEAEEPIWDSILRALLEGGRFADGARALATVASVDELSRMLSEFVDLDRPEAVPRDFDATFGIRVTTREQRMATLCSFIERTFGERLRSGPGPGLQNSLEQGVQLLAALAQPIRSVVLGGIIRALGGDETPLAVLRQFTSALPNDEVLEALRYLSSIGDLSPHAALLLNALTQSSPEAVPEAAPEESAVASLVALFGNDDVDRFNPPDHRELLGSVAIRIPEVPEEAVRALAELGTRAGTVASAVVERQVTTVLLDLLAVAEPGRAVESALARIEQTFRAWLERGAYHEASTLLDDLHAVAAGGSAELKGAIEAHIGAGSRIPALIESILEAEVEKLPLLRRIVTTLGTPALRHLLAALAEEGDLSRRRRLFDFIASLGPVIVPPAIEFLGDSRWYVVRNMIALLRVLEDRTSIPEVRKLGRHEDLRVRMEAIKSLFALDGNVPKNLLDDLFAHPDAKLAQGAVALVGAYKMKEGVDPLLRILSERDLLGGARMIRLKAIRALGEIGDPRALPALGGFFGGSWLPWPAREERLAVWQSLSHYPPAARAPFVEKGLKSRDGEIRAICARLAKR